MTEKETVKKKSMLKRVVLFITLLVVVFMIFVVYVGLNTKISRDHLKYIKPNLDAPKEP